MHLALRPGFGASFLAPVPMFPQEGRALVRSTRVSVLAIVSFALGVVAIVVALLMIPAVGWRYLTGFGISDKTTLVTVIGTLGLVGGVLYLPAGLGVWMGRRLGWVLSLIASVLVAASSIWASITVVPTLIPNLEVALAVLVLALAIGTRSSFQKPASPAIAESLPP